MLDSDKRVFSVATTTTVTVISSLIAGLLLAFFTDLIFKPQVLYTISSSKISLPAEYEKEIAKIRAVVFAKNFEKIANQPEVRNSLTIEAGIVDKKLGIKEHRVNVAAGRSGKLGDNTLGASGPNLEKLIDTFEKPEVLKTLLDPASSIPTAFAIIDIYNAGNREANDLEINIVPNGVLAEARVSSTEPAAEKWTDILDEQIRLPVGIHLPPIKRLPPEGKIRIKLYWNLLSETGESTAAAQPKVDVRGSFSGGSVQFVESKLDSPANWPLRIIFCLSMCLGGFAIGYWVRTQSRRQV